MFFFFILTFVFSSFLYAKEFNHEELKKEENVKNDCVSINTSKLYIELWGNKHSIKSKKDFFELNKSDQTLIALEGYREGNASDNEFLLKEFPSSKYPATVLPIEEDLPYAFSLLIQRINMMPKSSGIYSFTSKSAVIKLINREPRLKNYYEEFLGKQPTKYQKYLTEIKNILMQPEITELNMAEMNQKQKEKIDEINFYLDKFFRKFANYVANKMLLTPDVLKYPFKVGKDFLPALYDYTLREESVDKFIDLFPLNFRNQIFVSKLNSYLCNPLASQKLNKIAFFVGWEHVVGLNELLKKQFPNSTIVVRSPAEYSNASFKPKHEKLSPLTQEKIKEFSNVDISDESLMEALKTPDDWDWDNKFFYMFLGRLSRVNEKLAKVLESETLDEKAKIRALIILSYGKSDDRYIELTRKELKNPSVHIQRTAAMALGNFDLNNSKQAQDDLLSVLLDSKAGRWTRSDAAQAIMNQNNEELDKKIKKIIDDGKELEVIYALLRPIARAREMRFYLGLKKVEEISSQPGHAFVQFSHAKDANTPFFYSNVDGCLRKEVKEALDDLEDGYSIFEEIEGEDSLPLFNLNKNKELKLPQPIQLP
jgi:hypothetical protein